MVSLPRHRRINSLGLWRCLNSGKGFSDYVEDLERRIIRVGPEFNDKGPCKREAEKGCEAERRKTDAKEKGGRRPEWFSQV